ncbi:hypothetical protein KC19_7G093300 [Ceratodon purpureus]|uniref:Uncharacterized protein n=1 Tax=Ceratodon purpureus TaxID=3225 RepID=A0A8T0H6J1_CERPU|nr:hypothetical protein KC19_7G093300 [Ceratodon purpureus]
MVSFRDGGGSWCNGGRCSVTVGMSCLHRGKFGLVIADEPLLPTIQGVSMCSDGGALCK